MLFLFHIYKFLIMLQIYPTYAQIISAQLYYFCKKIESREI